MSFLYGEYEVLISTILDSGRPVRLVREALTDPGSARRSIFLRHDVDRFPQRSVRLAERERELSVRATYYFRCDKKGLFPNSAINRIYSLGHDVGFHYECLSRCDGDQDRALARFGRELEAFRQIAPCHTVAAHGNPLSRWNNMGFLAALSADNFRETYGLMGDALHQMALLGVQYFTDAGGRWNSVGGNLRDRVGENYPLGINPTIPREFVPFLRQTKDHVYISTHPERWHENRNVAYAMSLCIDKAAAVAKTILRATRRKT